MTLNDIFANFEKNTLEKQKELVLLYKSRKDSYTDRLFKDQKRKGLVLDSLTWSLKQPSQEFLNDRKLFSYPMKKVLSRSRQPELIQAFKQKLVLSKEQHELISGCLMGDVGMRQSGKDWSLKICQGHIHKKYAFHLYNQLYYYSLTSPVPFLRKTGLAWQWDTITHTAFNSYHSDWYVQTSVNKFKKIIPTNFETKYLSDRALAYWFQDDGYILDPKGIGKAIAFATHGFEEEEVKNLCKILAKTYSWKVWAKKNKDKFVVVISGDNFEDVIARIGPHIHNSMNYKIPTPRISK